MAIIQKNLFHLILLFAVFTLVIGVPTATPGEAESTAGKLEITPVDIAHLPASFNATVVPGDPSAETWLHCETSMGSPWVADVRVAIASLYAHSNDKCCQMNPFASKCSRLSYAGTAEIAICGKEYGCLSCGYVGNLAEALVNDCANWDRVGGQHFVHQGARIIVY